MNTLDMIGVVDAMQKRLFARVNLADADYADVVESKLEQEALASFAQGLREASPDESVVWLVKRVAQLEARVNALSRALHQMDKTAGSPAAEAPPSAPPAALDRALVSMDENVVQSGFYYPERTDTGVAIRWLGPEPTARVYLPKVALPAELTLYLAAAYKGVDLRAVRVALNDGPSTPVETDRVGNARVLRCRPVSGTGGDGLLHHIDIDCGATFRPADEGGSDARSLGIALSQIEIVNVS